MKNKRNILIILLSMILICCVGTVCAADSNNTVDMVSDVNLNEEYISVSDNEQVDDVDESVLSTPSKNNNWTINVDNLSADNDLLSDDDNFDDDDDPDDGEYNNYVDNNDYSVVDKDKEYFYNRIHSGNTLYFEFLTHLVDNCGFTLDIKNSNTANQIYTLVTTKDYSFKLYDGKQFNLEKGKSYIAAFNNRLDYNIYGSTFKDVVYVKDNVNYLDEDYLGWLHWDKKIGNTIPSDNLNNIIITDTIADSGNLPGYYNLMDHGFVSSFKKQLGGDCWAFAAIAALESHLMKTGDVIDTFSSDFDFSENHLRNVMSSRGEHGTDLSESGTMFMSSSYFARWSGPILESDDIYDKNRKDYSYESFYPVKHVQDMLFIPERKNANDNDLIKKAIMDYGAVVTTTYVNETDYRGAIINNKIVLTFNIDPNKPYGRHSVAIIGWNDTFSKDNFANNPAGDGAFIVKDSNFDCPVYVSYYDQYFAKTDFSMAFVNVEDPNNYKSIYQNDYAHRGVIQPFGVNVMSFYNKFVANDDEMITAVGFYNLQESECIVEVWVNNEKKYNSSKTSFLPGYHTVKLNTEISVKKGDNFEIRVKFNSKYSISVTIGNYKLPTNNSYYYYGNGDNKGQLYTLGDFGIKAYTSFPYNNGHVSYIESKDVTKDYDNNAITMGLLKDKDTMNIIKNGKGYIKLMDKYNKPIGSYDFISNDNGEIILTNILNPGSYDFNLIFNGNAIFSGCSKHISVKINKLATQIFCNDACIVEETLKFTLKHGNAILANRALDVYVNGEYRHLITNANGEIDIYLNDAIHYSISILFYGDVIFESLSHGYSLEVKKKNLDIELKNMAITYKNGDKIKVKVGKPNINVKLTIKGKTYSRNSDANGLVSFDVGKKPGIYTATFSIAHSKYQGTITKNLNIAQLKLNDNYSPGRKLTYKKHDLTLILSNKDSNKGIDGIKIKYKIEGHGINYKTTSNGGKITFKTSSLKTGSYAFAFRVTKSKYIFASDGKRTTDIKIVK